MLWTPQSKPAPGAQIDYSHPLARGLVGCWLFNEGSGVRANDLAQVNNGVLTGGCTRDGQSLLFNGSSGYVDAGAGKSLAVTGDQTLVARIQNSIANWGRIINRMAIGSPYPGYQFILWTDGRLAYGCEGGWVQSTSSWNDGRWHDVVVSQKGGVASFYGDGRSDGVAAAGIPTDGGVNLYIGRWSSGYFTGRIQYSLIYNRALTPSEVAQLAAEPYCMIADPSPRRYFIFKSEEEAAGAWIGAGFW